MYRDIAAALLAWKNSSDRKVLLVRGARQVGKTYSIRELGKTYQLFIEVNFEEEKGLKRFFQDSLNPQLILQNLAAYFSVSIIPEETLIFFDEIQSCPEAISALRFFYEKMPHLHVIAAGSLLEFALEDLPSQAVGRITSLFMYPLSFSEFLIANQETALLELIETAEASKPLHETLHHKAIQLFKTYQLIGGMPEVVKAYLKQRDLVLCQKLLDDLLLTIREDFAKYKKRLPSLRLNEVFEAIIFQTGQKFKYTNVASEATAPPLKEALELLIKAGLAYKIYHTAAQGLPLGAQINQKKFKIIFFDSGLHQRLLGLNMATYLLADEFSLINKGNLTEAFVGLELIKYLPSNLKPQLYYWHREERASNAEVDYIIQKNETILPIEVKAGTKGQMQSMAIFLKTHPVKQGVRVSLENFSEYQNITVVPVYALKRLS